VGAELGQIVKSLVFVAPTESRLEAVVALVSGSNRVDIARLSAVTGLSSLRRATANEATEATGFTIVGLDSSEPDVNEGRIGRDRYPWIAEQFDEPNDIRIVAVHHHLVPIPGTGRERNIVLDAGDLLLTLTTLDVDVVLCGHKHVPYFWGLNGMLICNSGTAGTHRVRASTPPSWNELHVDASTIKVFVHYLDGRRELSVIFSRKTRAMTRESFFVTREFLASNPLLAV